MYYSQCPAARFFQARFLACHKKHNTPYWGIIFTAIVVLIAPFFGRNVLGWVVDMSSVGVSIAYFYTCFTAYKILRWKDDGEVDTAREIVSPGKKFIAMLGMISSIGFLLLLLVPGSPAVLGKESFIALGIWIVVGLVFYLVKRKDLMSYKRKDLAYFILGKDQFNLKDSKDEEKEFTDGAV